VKHRTVFVALISFLVSAFLAHAVERVDPKTYPYTDPSIAGAPAPSGCTPTFLDLDANQDDYMNKAEAKKWAETTASWKRLDSDIDNRLSREEILHGNEIATRAPASF